MPKLEVKNPTDKVTITLDGDSGDVSVGGNAQDGDIIIKNAGGTERIRLDGVKGSVNARSAAMVMVFSVNGDTGEVILQGVNPPGHGAPRIRFSPENGTLTAGGNGQGGVLLLQDSAGKARIRLNAKGPEQVFIRDNAGKPVFNFAGDAAVGSGVAGLWIGAHKNDGGAKPALVVVRAAAGHDAVVLSGVGPEHLFIRDSSGKPVFNFAGDAAVGSGVAGLWIGAHKDDGGAKPGLIVLRDKAGSDSLVLDGNTGDIVLQNADCAEDFDVADLSEIEPGAVMMLDDEGRLRQSHEAYDRRVAGVVSGAGDYRPGIVMDRKPSPNPRATLAMVGKVHCRVDAGHGAIAVGDLLTTSPTRGQAMRAMDPQRAFGAVIGKALRPHTQGQGLIPILVGLQ